ncbi:sigma factor-like helix-turn-helix DNA-binding protein, partial [Lysinibacillus sp. D4B1_S16]|uniref:sigma factor-like helix-turn-helix DNA-binding protein n=1 Tax=Lysinibacillus sp. D4B1_S16 TaxID=2941231 RepID=UPI0024BD8549
NTPEQIIVEQDTYLKLINLLEQIKPIEKQIILICDVHDCTNEQAANLLQLNVNTVKNHLARGRKKMRVLIKREESFAHTLLAVPLSPLDFQVFLG